jgi:hypothetical protein
MEVILPNKNKKRIIILSILAFVFLASGIFLLWRVNQPETVAPEDSEAASAEYCQSIGCYYHAPTNSCTGIDGCVWRDGTGDQHCGGSCGSVEVHVRELKEVLEEHPCVVPHVLLHPSNTASQLCSRISSLQCYAI